MEAYVSQTGTSEANAARPLARRKELKLKSYGGWSEDLVERMLSIEANVAVCDIVAAMFV